MLRHYQSIDTKITRLNALNQAYKQTIRNLRNYGPGYTGFSLTGRKFEYDETSSYVKVGLPNKGSTCYLASIIQCLNAFSSPLRYLVNHRSELENIYMSCPEYHLLAHYVKLVYIGFNTVETNRNISFSNVVNEFFRIYSTSQMFKSKFPIFNDHDAHEFLINFLSYIDECVIEMEIVKKGIGRDEDLQMIYTDFEQRFSFSRSNFGYEILVTDFCLNNANHEKTRTETGSIYTLEIDGSKSIEECFAKSFNGFVNIDCSECAKQNQKFNRVKFFESLKDNLIIHLSRFKVIYHFIYAVRKILNFFVFKV